MSKKILISACLLGAEVRYDGKGSLVAHSGLKKAQEEGRLLAICPEVLGNLPIPRPKAEIAACGNGDEVLAGKAVVRTQSGEDVSEAFIFGAQMALAIAQEHGAKVAILNLGLRPISR